MFVLNREDQFTEFTSVSVFCATWNVNAKRLDEGDDLTIWLKPPDAEGIWDIYAIGCVSHYSHFNTCIITSTSTLTDGIRAQV
jgi:hypothetical protein